MSINKYFQLKKCSIQKNLTKMKKNIQDFYIKLILLTLTLKKLKMQGVMWQLLNFIKILHLMIFLKQLVNIGSKELNGIKKQRKRRINTLRNIKLYHQSLSKDKNKKKRN